MVSGEWNIRTAMIHDAAAIAEVHVESWKSTYAGIFPRTLLGDLSVEQRKCFWQDSLAVPSVITLVACGTGGGVMGFITGGEERTGQLHCEGEIYAIYLRQEAQRQGLGTLIVRRFVRELRTRGFASMAVWVVALNPSRDFYERLGGKVIGERQFERGGQSFTEIAYGWHNLSTFSE
jgi:GNAT superfamily N-acetyltransferase